MKISDVFPSNCLIFNQNLERLYSENNEYFIEMERNEKEYNVNGSYRYTAYLYVGYPKTFYNETNNNLSITNEANLYAEYYDAETYIYQDTDSVSLNLNDFKFTYSGNLYGISKDLSGTAYYEAITGKDPSLNKSYTSILKITARYTDAPMDVKIGDDLLYITMEDGTYKRLNENEYYFSSIIFPYRLYNGHGDRIPAEKYECELWIKYKNKTTYELHDTFKNTNIADMIVKRESWTFTESQHVVGFYFIIKDLKESIVVKNSYNYNYDYDWIEATVNICNTSNILEEGNVYNFAYIQVYKNGVLQNEPDINSYANFITQQEIATFDKDTYGTYMQRSCDLSPYIKYIVPVPKHKLTLTKSLGNIVQDVENECFSGITTISLKFENDNPDITPHIIKNYNEQMPDNYKIVGFELYDLLPKGMILTSTEQEILDSYTTGYYSSTGTSSWVGIYLKDKCLSKAELDNLIKNNLSVAIYNNYNNTGRTLLSIKCTFEETPLIFTNKSIVMKTLDFKYNYEISYDSFLEYGSVWTNRVYCKPYNRTIGESFSDKTPIFVNDKKKLIIDNGREDSDEIDINNNGDVSENMAFSSNSITITSVVSTHQDVTTYVKTDQSYYSTGTVDASNNSEYEYKLRVRTGAADVTNLIVYSNIEEAQPERTRWKGDFIDINTSYAESKGYTVKPYYSENPAAGNLYNEDGSLNSDWKEYIPDTPEIVANGLAITFDENFKTYNSSDYLYIYYYYNGQLYRSSQYYNSTLAGQTIEIPSTDIYFYWYTSSSGNSAYGFKVNNIEPKVVTTTLGSIISSLPSYTPTELTGNNYPETSHNPYENNSRLLWHYIYTDNLIVQEHQEHIDKTKVKSLAFEYLDSEGNPAILPSNSLTYVLIQMKSPADESIKTLARMDCRTQWNALDDYDRPVDFITGINSNVVKVALPNSVDEDSIPNITLKFIKEINGTDSEFENLKLDKAAQQIFMIRLTSLTANDDGSYNQLTALLKSNQELIISQIPIGTYLLEELGDNYFDFVEFADNNDPEIIIEGVTFERTDQGYIITVSEDLIENIEFNIKVTNEIEDERFFESKNNKENLFLINKNELDHDIPQD